MGRISCILEFIHLKMADWQPFLLSYHPTCRHRTRTNEIYLYDSFVQVSHRFAGSCWSFFMSSLNEFVDVVICSYFGVRSHNCYNVLNGDYVNHVVWWQRCYSLANVAKNKFSLTFTRWRHCCYWALVVNLCRRKDTSQWMASVVELV